MHDQAQQMQSILAYSHANTHATTTHTTTTNKNPNSEQQGD